MRALLAPLLLGCAASVTNTAAQDAGTAGDCTWRADPSVEVSPQGDPRHRLVEAAESADGAWVAFRSRQGAVDTLYLTRLNDDGTPHAEAGARGVALLQLPVEAQVTLSMLPDARGVTLLTDGPTDRGACVWARVEGTARTFVPVDLSQLEGFSHSGCGAMLARPGGYSFVSEQVRALWGTTLGSLSNEGRLQRSGALPMTSRPTLSPMSRVALDDGDFVGSWTESVERPTGSSALRARRFSADGVPRGDAQELATSAETFKDFRVLRSGGGLVALWEGAADRFPSSDTLLVRALTDDGAPRGDATALTSLGFYLGGLSAAARGDRLFVTAITARDGIQLEALLLSPRGALQAQIPSRLAEVDGPLRRARVVTTGYGALLLATVAQGPNGGRVVAVPLRCR